ncbi:hypothetical protein [Burkholderia sp. S171]|uniref:hypothetical protein n=1 Tax=Burkholderia sp. S171 TaxID=1641860 RepID=UPI00131DE893|nr:hypothetical protein [Burkholderia sp. S171]
MNTQRDSLRRIVDKWLAPTPGAPVCEIRLCRMPVNHVRYVRVEALRPSGVLALLFFRHDDGSWQVFPPEALRMTMSPRRLAM